MNNQNTSANDPSNCSPIAAKRSSFHTLEVSCLRHLSLQVPPFCMCGSSHKGCLGANLLSRYIFNPPTSPPSWDDNRSDTGVVWRRGCGCKRSRTPDNGFRNFRVRIKKLHLCCVDCVDFLQIGLVLGSSGASFACLLWCSSNIPFIRGWVGGGQVPTLDWRNKI